jgi:hypothetical protein
MAPRVVLSGAVPCLPNARYQPRPKAGGCMPWFGAMAYSVRLAGPLAASTHVMHCSGGTASYRVTRLATLPSPP